MAIARDYECAVCHTRYEYLSHPSFAEDPAQCPKCESLACFRVPQAALVKTIVKGNKDFAKRERERLTKRSDEHWKKKGKDEAVDREKAQFKREGIMK